MNFNTLDFRSTVAPPSIRWPDRVTAWLDAMPAEGFTPEDDWAIVGALAIGEFRPGRFADKAAALARAKALANAARDDSGRFCLSGRAALIEVVRARAGE